MIDTFQAEMLTLRHSFVKKLILIAPLFFIAIALPQTVTMPPEYMRPWVTLTSQVFNWWSVIFIPFGFALIAALVANQERKAGTFRTMRIHTTSPRIAWIAKIAVIALYSLAASLVLVASTAIAGAITADGAIPFAQIIGASLACWVASLSLIPLQLFIATWKGTLASMAVGFVGIIAGIALASQPLWFLTPWSWTVRLLCPIIGVHPNGVPLVAGDALLDPGIVLPALLLSVVVFVLLSLMTARWFERKEFR